jgi:tRNA-2-methylthio-N6-dimethylallyladenosine synthase
MRFFIETIGCQMNQLDARLLEGALRRCGWEAASGPDGADAVLLFTCSVRSKPEEKVFSRLGQLRPLKDRNPALRIGVLGCMAERLGPAVRERAPVVDIVAGPGNFLKVPELLSTGALHEPSVLCGFDEQLRFTRDVRSRRSAVQAFVSVMRGCQKGCSYCVVPGVRGPERSRTLRGILDEVERLADDGVREVTLLGQSIGSWGRDIGEALPALLRRVCAVPGLLRVRFLTSHPADFHPELLRVFGETERLCPHLQMPAQSGSDRILEAMNRGYSSGDYRRLLESIRGAVPDMEITSDFIVGFPGETDADFRETLDLVGWAGFRNVFAFKYVPRPKTKAAQRSDDVPPHEKQNRLRALLDLQKDVGERRNREMIGRVVTVLSEGPSPRDRTRWTGRTPHNHIVTFEGPDRCGSTPQLSIRGATALTLEGTRTHHEP